MRLWTYRRRFEVAGHRVEVRCPITMSQMHGELRIDGQVAATGTAEFYTPTGPQNLLLAASLPDGRRLRVEAGYNSWWNVGMAATLDEQLVWESHPGKPIAMPAGARKMYEAEGRNPGGARFEKHKWAMAVDIGLALLFFVMAKLTDLPTAAIVGAGAGLAVIVAQRFVKVDIVGGLALFGVVMGLLTAGYSLAFQDDWAVKMRSTILGAVAAGLFLTDAAFGGRYLGKRLGLYMPDPHLDPRRLAFGIGVSGLVAAGLNYLVATYASTDFWLTYTTFLDIPLALAMFFVALRFAKRREGEEGAPAAA